MQAKNKESNAIFRAVYDRQFGRVYRLSAFLTGKKEDAEDVLQTVFTRYLEKRPHFKDEEHEKAWFVTVTKNLCKDLQKQAYRKRRASLDEAAEAAIEFSYNGDSELWQTLKELPEKYQTVLYLYYYEGYPVRELSKMLHKKESTLQTWLADGRKKLRNILETE